MGLVACCFHKILISQTAISFTESQVVWVAYGIGYGLNSHFNGFIYGWGSWGRGGWVYTYYICIYYKWYELVKEESESSGMEML